MGNTNQCPILSAAREYVMQPGITKALLAMFAISVVTPSLCLPGFAQQPAGNDAVTSAPPPSPSPADNSLLKVQFPVPREKLPELKAPDVVRILGTCDGVKLTEVGNTVVAEGRTANMQYVTGIAALSTKFGNLVNMVTFEWPQTEATITSIKNNIERALNLGFDPKSAFMLKQTIDVTRVYNKFVVSGLANNPEDIEMVKKICQLYGGDQVVVNMRVRQEMIEVDTIFAKVTLKDDSTFGTTGLQSVKITVPSIGVTWSPSTRYNKNTQSVVPEKHGLSGAYDDGGWYADSTRIGVETGDKGIINAVFRDCIEDSKILVRPHLAALNCQEAIFHAGGQRGYNLVTNEVQNRVYVDYGTKLIVTPSITSDGQISMKVSLELKIPSTGDEFVKYSHDGFAILGRNDAMVISGLVNELRGHSSTKTPCLGQMPVLKYLFGQDNDVGTRDEMVVLLRPNVPKKTASKSQFATSNETYKAAEKAGSCVEERNVPIDLLPGDPKPKDSAAAKGKAAKSKSTKR